MAEQSKAFKRRLSNVRRRWKTVRALDGALLVATEALGLFLVFLLADAIYHFGGEVRVGMLGAGLVVLAALFVRHVVRPILLRIPDDQIALYIEERSSEAEGAVISALECAREPRGGLHRFIAGFLMDDAVRRIDRTSVRMLSNLGRLRKHLLVAFGLLAAFAVTSLSFPGHTWQRSERIIAPWESILRKQEEAQMHTEAEIVHLRHANRRIEFDVLPKGMAILRGKGVEFTVTLSREPAENPVFHYQFAGSDTKEHAAEMLKDQARFGYRLPFPDISESLTYYVSAARQASAKYEVKVYDPLAVRGIELTFHYPDYLQREPTSVYGSSGDVTALAGTRVDVRIIANNPLKAGTLKFGDGAAVAMKVGAKPEDGATGTFSVGKDTSYTYELADVYGEKLRFEDFFFVKAVPDKPPTITMVSPKVDMSVHPLCELTFGATVADDFAIQEAVAQVSYFRDGKPTPMPLAMKPATQGDFKSFLEGKVEHVLALEDLAPRSKVGDMIFYHMEVTDRKGQTVRTDLFFVKLMPFEVAAAWPADPSPPDLPHWDYLWTPDIILLAAAAWHIEQQRGKIPDQDFQGQCTQLAGRMEPAMNSQNGLNLLGGKQKLPRHILEAAADLLALANQKLQKALELVRQFEPGKAALEMQQAMALAESVNTEKALQEIEMAQTPIHTGQPSGGYNQDAVQEQVEFRLPGVMSDSLTAFQQEDNPRHFLPPDYRRALRLKQRTAPLTKELKLAGEIYASQEQLLEMAREQFGHRKLREAAEMSCTNDPAAGSGTRGEMIRVDKRAIPYASMDSRADMPDVGNRGQMKQPKVEKIKGLKYAKLSDNSRAGPPSPHRSQTPGGGASDEDDDDEKKPSQEKKRRTYYDEQWKVEANDRRPRMNQGGGGGGGSQQQQQQQLGMEQPQQRSGGSSSSQGSSAAQQLAAQQTALANRAGELARGVARSSEPGDMMGERAATGLRDASREMRRAADSFGRGDLRTGIAQARRAQQAMRTAMHGMRAAQFGTLDKAVAAAQQGADALVQNQYRVSEGTGELDGRVRELSGETPQTSPGTGQPGPGRPGQAQPGQAQPGAGQPGQQPPGKGQPTKGQPGQGQPGQAQPGQGQPGQGQPGQAEPGQGQPGQGQPGQGQPGQGQPGQGQPGEARPGTGEHAQGEPGKGQPGTQGEPGKGRPGTGQVAQGQPGKGQPGAGQPGKGQPTKGQPGSGRPGEGRPGEGAPGGGEPGEGGQPGGRRMAGPSPAAIGKAKAQDPRIAARMKSLAGEQMELSEAVKDFEAYVGDLVKWSKEAERGRVTTSLKDVTEGLRQDGVAQKMVDAGVDLSQDDIGSALATQEEIEEALDRMAGRLREAGDILAGSKTGIISRAARQAKELGTRVRAVAGLPQEGGQGGQRAPGAPGHPGQAQPAQGQPGQGQPGQGQPSQGQPGQTQVAQAQPGAGQPGAGQPSQGQPGVQQPGQGQPGQSQPGQGQPAQGQPGQGQPGQGQPGQGQPGQGQPTQGQPGQGQPGGGQPRRGEESLAERLAAEQQGRAGMSPTAGRPGPGTNVLGGAGRGGDEIDDLWFKARDLAETLRDEQLADDATVDYIHRRVEDPKAFRTMFEKVKKAEAGRFANVVTGVGKSLDEVLKETLSAKKLQAERREDCPQKFRSFVDAYFESLSKAATGKPMN